MSRAEDLAFARHGGEKMLYDVRMGPQAVLHQDTIYMAYQANSTDARAHPHMVTYSLSSETWSKPVRIGTVTHYDHHFAPVLWFDPSGRIHVLYNCHARDGGTHIVSSQPGDIDAWEAGPAIAQSISYPRVLPVVDGQLLLYYRTYGHMGYWTYQLSGDGGFSWTAPSPLVDMDRDPQRNEDVWAGSYHSVWPSSDGCFLHIAFVYLDERKSLNPLYNRRFHTKTTINRYHLYYLRLDIKSGQLFTIDGETVERPVNRQRAERGRVWDTGHRLTNMPSIALDERGDPRFLMPVSKESPWECTFHFVQRVDGQWAQSPVASTNGTWSGSLLQSNANGTLSAYVVSGKDYGELIAYGGGDLEEWISHDGGGEWVRNRRLTPEPELLCNNPQPLYRSDGSAVDGHLAFFGWRGPGSLHGAAMSRYSEGINRAMAFLWQDGRWL